MLNMPGPPQSRPNNTRELSSSSPAVYCTPSVTAVNLPSTSPPTSFKRSPPGLNALVDLGTKPRFMSTSTTSSPRGSVSSATSRVPKANGTMVNRSVSGSYMMDRRGSAKGVEGGSERRDSVSSIGSGRARTPSAVGGASEDRKGSDTPTSIPRARRPSRPSLGAPSSIPRPSPRKVSSSAADGTPSSKASTNNSVSQTTASSRTTAPSVASPASISLEQLKSRRRPSGPAVPLSIAVIQPNSRASSPSSMTRSYRRVSERGGQETASAPAQTTIPIPALEGSRRTPYHLSASPASSSSTHRIEASVQANGLQPLAAASSSAVSLTEEGVPETIDLASSRSASNESRAFVQPNFINAPLHIEIPKRRSSASPQISPRRSSIAAFEDQLQIGQPGTHRRASRAIMLGDMLTSRSQYSLRSMDSESSFASRRSDGSLPPMRDPRVSRRSDGSIQPMDRPNQPGSPRLDRRASNQSPHASPHRSPRTSYSASGVSSTPRPDRLSPSLTNQTSPSPTISRIPAPISRPSASRLVSSTSPRASPPIPMKNPLRILSRQSSSFSDLKAGRPTKSRTGSGDSLLAVAGTPSAAELPIPEETHDQLRASPASMVAGSTPAFPFPETKRPETTADDIRFTMLTAASDYSQDSAPTTAKSFAPSEESTMSPESEGVYGGEQPTGRLNSVDWGRKRDGMIMDDSVSLAETDETADAGRSQLARLALPSDVGMISTESPVTASTLNTQGTTSDWSKDAAVGHTPVTPHSARAVLPPTRSPSMPAMNGTSPASKAARILSLDELPMSHAPRAIGDSAPLLPSALQRSPTAPKMIFQTSSISVMSKRSHLIREIATTERAYANDLGLIRDAYLLRHLRRPASQYSVTESTISPGNVSDASRRSSVYTYQTAETKRSSGHDSLNPAWTSSGGPPVTPLSKGSSSDSAFYGSVPPSTAPTSVTSLATTPQPSPRNASRTSIGMNGLHPPVGKPLSPVDVKAVFLNLDQLAAAADELATAFEGAMGEQELRPGTSARGGDLGTDRLGQVFASLLPRLRPLYQFYCARQSTASVRLVELQADPAHAAYLNDCWASVKPRTRAWNLDSMLIKPVQRITKYPLLFEDLLACTTPVHPDYFSIRTAAELARSVALEIDESKRRKDVVANVITPKRSQPLPAAIKDRPSTSKGIGLKLFRKDKSNGLSKSSPSNDLGPPQAITSASNNHLKDLVTRVEQSEQIVRQIGKEVVLWTAAAKDVFVVEDTLLRTWLRVYQLDSPEAVEWRLPAFRLILEDLMADSWAKLNLEVRDRIMPIFAKLLEAAVNPRKVIVKRDLKVADYGRYMNLRDSGVPIDRLVFDNARDFVALHSQLVDELPTFLEGYMRILDIAIFAFARAQAAYHASVRDKLATFAVKQMRPPRRVSTPSNVVNLDNDPIDLSSGHGIIKAWHESWNPYAEAMDHFQCTRPARAAASRIASFNNRPGSRPTSRSGSSIQAPSLKHSTSMISQRSPEGSRSSSPAFGRPEKTRQRASTLSDQPPPSIAPAKESRFGLLRGSSKRVASPGLPIGSRSNGSRPSSLYVENSPTNRYSFGLPKLSADPTKPIFDGLGLSPAKMTGPSSSLRAAPDHHHQGERSRHSVNGNDADHRNGLGLGDVGPPARTSSIAMSTDSSRARTSKGGEVDSAEGWRNERVLYQCACVAEFDPAGLGNRKYRGLHFLRMDPGDLVDVFHEVGRIDELPSFPYPEVGVDNDGVLVGRTENGAIGLVICSFLEPLRD